MDTFTEIAAVNRDLLQAWQGLVQKGTLEVSGLFEAPTVASAAVCNCSTLERFCSGTLLLFQMKSSVRQFAVDADWHAPYITDEEVGPLLQGRMQFLLLWRELAITAPRRAAVHIADPYGDTEAIVQMPLSRIHQMAASRSLCLTPTELLIENLTRQVSSTERVRLVLQRRSIKQRGPCDHAASITV